MTAKIHRLPEDLVNKIAAGEVIERPASVVKELVENALDAGAAKVVLEVEAGGKSLIQVRDDGSGMGREDAERALERHATSKLGSFEDLQDIITHGFRGEALPSIASVSHLVLRTCEGGSATGTEVEVRHGRLIRVGDTGHPRGTSIEVRDLFGAVPARRKFLRADATEAGHVAEVVTQLALARPGTGFEMTSAGRILLQAPPVDGLAARVYQLFGGPLLDELLTVDGAESWAAVRGFVSRPDRARASRPTLRFFVNGRIVRDRGLAKALSEAYRRAGAADRRPEAFLFIDVPPHLVDVNVHPAKTEVRFADPRVVFGAVEKSVRDSLSAGGRDRAPRADTSRVQEAAERYLARAPAGADRPVTGPLGFGSIGFAMREAAAGVPEAGADPPASLWNAPGPLTVLGQHRHTYIVCSDGEDLILVDQHTAHERVRFETLMASLESRAVESQLLLVPVVLTLPPALRPVLAAHVEALAAVGFDAEEFGGDSIRLRAAPALLGTRHAGGALEAVLRDLLEREATGWLVSGLLDRLAATLACHSSVRAGQQLSGEQMSAIVRDLGRAHHPTLCPHGRPTQVRVPRDDVARWFGRTGWRRQ